MNTTNPLETLAHAEGLEVYPAGETPYADELLILKPAHAHLLGETQEAAAAGDTRAAVASDAITILGRLNANRIEDLVTGTAAPTALEQHRRTLRLLLDQEIGALGNPVIIGQAESIKALVTTHNALGIAIRQEEELGTAPAGPGVDETLDTVYRVVSALPGLESATDVADTVDARVREELAR